MTSSDQSENFFARQLFELAMNLSRWVPFLPPSTMECPPRPEKWCALNFPLPLVTHATSKPSIQTHTPSHVAALIWRTQLQRSATNMWILSHVACLLTMYNLVRGCSGEERRFVPTKLFKPLLLVLGLLLVSH